MCKILLFSCMTFLLLTVSASFGFQTKGQECTKCHTLKKEEALSLLKTFDQNIKVTDVKQSPAKYLWEVSVETGGKKGVLYIDLPKKNVISGSIIEIKGKKASTVKRFRTEAGKAVARCLEGPDPDPGERDEQNGKNSGEVRAGSVCGPPFIFSAPVRATGSKQHIANSLLTCDLNLLSNPCSSTKKVWPARKDPLIGSTPHHVKPDQQRICIMSARWVLL